jgi:hypothetical protein
MADLDDLWDALAKVRDAKADDDDYDSNDGYFPDDDEDKEDDEDEDDYSSSHPHRVFRTSKLLLDRLHLEAELEADKNWKAQNQEVIRRNSIRLNANRPAAKLPPTKEEQSRAELLRLQKQKAKVVNQMELEQKVEQEFQKYVVALKRRYRAGLGSP